VLSRALDRSARGLEPAGVCLRRGVHLEHRARWRAPLRPGGDRSGDRLCDAGFEDTDPGSIVKIKMVLKVCCTGTFRHIERK
jgi:hypothetical protein